MRIVVGLARVPTPLIVVGFARIPSHLERTVGKGFLAKSTTQKSEQGISGETHYAKI